MADCLTIANAAKVTITAEGGIVRISVLKMWTDVVHDADNRDTTEIMIVGDPEVVDLTHDPKSGSIQETGE